jgi:hypothetical protein
MSNTTRQTKITVAEMRASGVRGVLVYCSDYRCSHSVEMIADQWPDDVRLSAIEPRLRPAVLARIGVMRARQKSIDRPHPEAAAFFEHNQLARFRITR